LELTYEAQENLSPVLTGGEEEEVYICPGSKHLGTPPFQITDRENKKNGAITVNSTVRKIGMSTPDGNKTGERVYGAR